MTKKYGEWILRKDLQEGGQAHTFIVTKEGDVSEATFVLKRLKNKKRLERFEREINVVLDSRNGLAFADCACIRPSKAR